MAFCPAATWVLWRRYLRGARSFLRFASHCDLYNNKKEGREGGWEGKDIRKEN